MSKLDDELARIDLASRATHLFRSLGCADEQAADAYAALAPKFTFDDGVLSFMGKPADADTMRAYLKESNRGYFLPADSTNNKLNNTADVKAPKMDAALVASAKAGNLTAKGQLVKAHGLAAVDAVLAGTAGDHKSDADRRARAALTGRDDTGQFTGPSPAEREAGKNNPWAEGQWNATRQSQIVKALGMEAAQRIAKAASSYVGATKPAKAA